MFEAAQAAPGLPRRAWSVAGLVHAIADALASRFSACVVRGELSGWTRSASGHCYFTLKDSDGGDALMRCAMFRRAAGLIDFVPRDGTLVTIRGRLAVYEPRGELQFVAESMQPAGAGALYEQYLRLKARLSAEGLFDAERKRPLPTFPCRIGIVTSLGAAALHDVTSCFARRAPQVRLVVYPAAVQGPEAPAALVRALQLAATRNEVDLLLLCRGGGSLEDLWAFNDERVVRAVAASPLVVVCGVGHETDVSLCDFAADVRAATPTAAAELAAPAAAECLQRLAALAHRLGRRVHHALDTHGQRLDRAAQRLSRPSELLHREQRRLDRLASRSTVAIQRSVDVPRQRLQRLGERLHQSLLSDLAARERRLAHLSAGVAALDPAKVLRRGYAWLGDVDGRPITTVAALTVGDGLTAVLADGRVAVRVTGVDPDPAGA